MRPGALKICGTDVTVSCTDSDAVNAYVFINMMPFAKANIIFPDVLRQDNCYGAR